MRKEFVGVDLGGTKLLIVRGDERHRIETGPAATPALIEAELRRFLATRRMHPAGIGIAVPGLVDGDGRVRACDVLPAIVGWQPAETFADLGCSVVVLNDAKAALVEETHDAEPNATAGVVMAGTAIGAAFLVGGKPLTGVHGWAGELGYLPIAINHEVKRLDELAGGASMAARLGIDGKALAGLAAAKDPAALAVIREGGHALGLALAGVINLLNPARLSLGGGSLSLPGYRDAARATATRYSLPDSWNACSLFDVRAGEGVVALGAARSVGR